MLYDVNAQARRREAMRRELDRPVVIEHTSLSFAGLPADRDAAVLAWFDRVFQFYDIDPTAATRWEQLAMRLALERFPNFAVLTTPPKVGNPGTKDEVMRLFGVFRNYQVSRSSGSKYKNFLRDHPADCEACNIRTAGSLKEAMGRARRQAEQDRIGEELITRLNTMKALGLA